MTELTVLPDASNEAAVQLKGLIAKLSSFLPPTINPEQFFAAVLTEVNQLAEDVSPKSVIMCTVNAAIIGLLPGPALGHCHFIPYWHKRGTPQEAHICQLVIGYKGFLELAFSNEFLVSCSPEVVLKDEQFERWHETDGPKLRHSLPLNRRLQKSDVIAAYCTYATKGGGTGIALVDRMELDRVDTGQNVWLSDYVAMARKSAVRRAAKEWRLSNRMARAVMLDEQAERGAIQSCPELAIEDTREPETVKIDNTRRTFDATLNHLIGCQSHEDRDQILTWALGEPTTYPAVVELIGIMQHILFILRERNKVTPWETMLQHAGRSGSITSDSPTIASSESPSTTT